MGEKGEGSGGEGGGKWGERGRELGMGYPPVHPLLNNMPAIFHYIILKYDFFLNFILSCDKPH